MIAIIETASNRFFRENFHGERHEECGFVSKENPIESHSSVIHDENTSNHRILLRIPRVSIVSRVYFPPYINESIVVQVLVFMFQVNVEIAEHYHIVIAKSFRCDLENAAIDFILISIEKQRVL